MRKVIKFLITIGIIAVLGVMIWRHYINLKDERFNKYIENANKAINNKEYKIAEMLLEKAKNINSKDKEIYKMLDEIQFDQEQNQIFDRAIELEKMQNYYEAINVFEEISPKAENLSRISKEEIKNCKKKIIDAYVEQANQVLSQGNVEYANYLLTKIRNVDSSSPEIGILEEKIKNNINNQENNN